MQYSRKETLALAVTALPNASLLTWLAIRSGIHEARAGALVRSAGRGPLLRRSQTCMHNIPHTWLAKMYMVSHSGGSTSSLAWCGATSISLCTRYERM